MEYNIKKYLQEERPLHIAICDDSEQEIKRLVQMLERFAEQKSLSFSLHTFTRAQDMLDCSAAQPFSLYFLDIMMPGMDGMTAAQHIRRQDTEAKIVFLTSFNEYAYQSYRVQAFDYLLKPADEQDVFALLSRLQALREQEQEEEYLCVQNGRQFIRLPFQQISHLEINQKKLYFHLTSGEVCCIHASLSEYEPQLLARPEFIKIHRSYLVNLKQISALSTDGCMMFDGENLPVSRLLYQRVREQVMSHLFGSTEV